MGFSCRPHRAGAALTLPSSGFAGGPGRPGPGPSTGTGEPAYALPHATISEALRRPATCFFRRQSAPARLAKACQDPGPAGDPFIPRPAAERGIRPMRGKRLSAILTTLATVAATAVPLVAITAVLTAAPSASAATATQPYTWQNVKIGGGGFIDGIEFSPAQQNLLYAHTDIGGGYRWNSSTSTWTPLLDWGGGGHWGWNGVVSLAPDPSNANKVWAAVGMYTNSYDPNNGAILRSSNQGATWQSTTLPFKLGGNMPGRGMGERLAVDPNDDNILYLGAPSGNGLWRSTDGGVTWSQVTSFPNLGNYAPDPTDTTGYR